MEHHVLLLPTTHYTGLWKLNKNVNIFQTDFLNSVISCDDIKHGQYKKHLNTAN